MSAPAGGAPTGGAPTQEAPTGGAPTQEAPTGGAQTQDAPTGGAQTQDAPTGGGGAEAPATEETGKARLKPAPGGLKAFRLFLYNGEKHTCLGRTGRSWLEITIFYIIFYTFLFLKLYVVILIFYLTIDANKPKLQGDDSLLRGTPGIVAYQDDPDDSRPKVENVIEPPLISYDPKNEESYRLMVRSIEDRMEEFLDFQKELSKDFINVTEEKCKDAEAIMECREGMQLVIEWPAATTNCSKANNYGYPSGKPCILFMLNRIFGWKPSAKGLTAVKISCSRKSGGQPGDMTYHPAQGFPSAFFPYKASNYVPYPIFLKFDNPPKEAVVMQCKPEDDKISIPSAIKYNTEGIAIFKLEVKQ